MANTPGMADRAALVKSVVAYLFFGVCTTGVNVFSYWLMARVLAMGTMPSTVAAWFFAVFFAFFTNRKWVFHSDKTTRSDVLRECASFFSCRLTTGVVDWVFMFFFVEVLAFDDILMKFLVNLLVIILNFVLSKFVVFRKGK